jgi:hypothetical protein
VSHKEVLGLLPLYIFISDLCNAIKHSKYLSFGDDNDCILLQTDIEHIKVWCKANFVKSNSSKIMVTAFTGKTNIRHYSYKLWNPSITRRSISKTLGYN